MAFAVADRVKETTTTTGTGTVSLAGAETGFQTFVAGVGSGNTTYYAIIDDATGDYEVGVGTVTDATPDTLSRDTVLSSSNSDAKVDFQAGSKNVFVTQPADKAVYKDSGSDTVTIDQIQLEAQSEHPSYSEGLLWYDSIHNTLNYYGDESGLVHEVGVEEHQKVYNNSGVTIAKGEPLYFSGNFNGYPTAARANATDVNKYNAQGIAAHSIENNTYGYVCTAGLVEDVDTSGLSAGTNFFVGLTDGAVQNASPTYPNFPMCLGWVVSSDASSGILLVNQQNHSVRSFRVQTDTHIGGDLVIDGDLTVVGSQTIASSTNVETGAPFLYLNSGDSIGEANTTFTGSGLDDAYFAGHFTGTASTTYYVKIDATGTPDTFSWSKDNFSTTEATGVAITGGDQTLDNGIKIDFGSTTGHTLNDVWSGTAAPLDVDTGIWSNRNTGGSGVGYTHVGMFFDVTDSKFKLVDEYDPEPTGTIDTGDASYSAGTLVVDDIEGVDGALSGALSVTGNITVGGTVDGRDVATDGTKLDGIEANATADQTDAEIKTAYENNSDTNALTDALLSKLNAIDANATPDQTAADIRGLGFFDTSNDGSGSGLDADLLDGNHASAFATLSGANFSGQVSVSSATYPPLLVTRDAGSNTTGNFGSLKLNTSTTGTPANGLGTYAGFFVDNVLKGSVGFENDGTFYVIDASDNSLLTVDSSGNVELTGNISFGDNDKAIFGAGDDLQIYHDSATSTNKVVGSIDVTGTVTADGLNVLGITEVSVLAGTNASTTYHTYKYNTSTVSGYVGNGSSLITGANNSDFIVRSQADLVFASNGNNRTMTLDTSGNVGIGTNLPTAKLNVAGTGLANTPTLAIDNSSSATYIHPLEAFTANMTAGQSNILVFGKEGSNKNSGYIGYNWAGAGSNSNYVSIGHWGSNHLLRVYADGNVTVGANRVLTVADEGSGNGLDADTVDGIQGASFLRSDTADTFTDIRFPGSTNNARFVTSGAWGGYLQTDNGYIHFGPANASYAHIYTDRPYFYFNKALQVNGATVLTTSDEGSGNGIDADTVDGQHASAFQPAANELTWVDQATGNYGTIKVDDDRSVTWAGYAIRDHWVLMFNGAERGGIYNDTDNEWALQCYQNAQVALYYNGQPVCSTTSAGLDLNVDSTDVLNFTANSTNDSRGISFNSRTALSADYNDGWMRLNQNSEFTNGTYSPKRISSSEQIVAGNSTVTSGGQLVVSASASPYLSWHESSTRRAYIQYITADNTLFIYNEEAGNLKFRGNATSVNFDFQTTGAANTGRLFVDADDFAMQHANGESIVYGRKDANTWLYYNGQWKIRTQASGVDIRNEASTNTEIRMTTGSNADTRGYVYANTSNQVGFLDSDGNWAVRVTRDTDVDFLVNNVEKFSIGTSSTVSVNDLTVNSDERIKDNVELIPNALEKVQAIRGVTFNRTDTDDNTRHAGVIAQEVEKVLPEVVTEDEETGIKSVAYANMVGLLIRGD
jgi:hypothetical protein